MSRWGRRRLPLAWGAASVAWAGLALVVELRSHDFRPSAVGISINLVVGLSFAATGLIAWARRPENNTGRLLLLVSFTWSLALFEAANDGVVSAIGVAGGVARAGGVRAARPRLPSGPAADEGRSCDRRGRLRARHRRERAESHVLAACGL